ncbi:hypothetical protein F3Y22_tig00112114pilonHSYRG00222 [Hibiscus syriacus]|uniref:Uncharacterized protein n=1 Tax=Hibiscus syriacus TaxID=106335 RepID=A0A6A2X656_HIBSY|nr:hypothetical protein F3Y22_tig00112114pilonHSYRG00222 [Hibiscus syriacus]
MIHLLHHCYLLPPSVCNLLPVELLLGFLQEPELGKSLDGVSGGVENGGEASGVRYGVSTLKTTSLKLLPFLDLMQMMMNLRWLLLDFVWTRC